MAAGNTIVVPTDFSESSLAALPWARRMAEQLQAEIHVVYVVEEPHIYATLDMGPVPIPSMDELARSADKRMAQFSAAHLKDIPRLKTAGDRRPSGGGNRQLREAPQWRADHHDDARLQRHEAHAPRQHHRGGPAPCQLPGAVDPQPLIAALASDRSGAHPHLCAEYAPLAKVGGLGDVTAGLSNWLAGVGISCSWSCRTMASMRRRACASRRMRRSGRGCFRAGDTQVPWSVHRMAGGAPGDPDVFLVDAPELFGNGVYESGER